VVVVLNHDKPDALIVGVELAGALDAKGVKPALATALLMDERAGRAITAERGLQVAVTAAVIGMANSRGLIASARDAFARLHGLDFRISAQAIEMVLRRVGE
jgi:predicted nucleic acid-binding protein